MSFNFLAVYEEYFEKTIAFEDALIEVGLGDYVSFSCDTYDASLELFHVNDKREGLTEEQQKVIHDHGFAKVYVNYNAGDAVVYDWGSNKLEEFKPATPHPVNNRNKYKDAT